MATGKASKASAEEIKKAEEDFLNSGTDTMEGFEDINSSTMAIPFIRILQDLSPQVKKKDPGYVEDAEVGDWYNTVTKDLYDSPLKVIVLKFERVYIEWRPDRGGFVSYHTPENAERIAIDKTFGKWKTVEGNDLQETYVYFLLLADDISSGVVILSCTSTAIKTSKEWNRLMTTHVMDNGERAMPYYIVWDLYSEYRTKDQYSWYGFTPKFNAIVTKEQYLALKPERKALPDRRVDYAQLEGSVHTEETIEEDTAF